MKNEYLQFDKCLQRLEHSFLKVYRGFHVGLIRFQHPSLRDMLFTMLQNEPQVRLQYISNASPDGLSGLIEGIVLSEGILNYEAHTLVIRSENEIKLLCKRTRIVVTETIPPSVMIKILNSADVLIPRMRGKKIAPGDLDLIEFSKTSQGKVLREILNSIAKQNTYDNNATYSFLAWIIILLKFYELTPYIVTIPHPEYISLLLARFKNANISDSIHFMELLFRYEPLIFVQMFNKKLEKQWHKSIVTKLYDYYDRGNEVDWSFFDDYESAQAEYDDWHTEVDELIDLAHTFYSFSSMKKPGELFKLEKLKNEALNPPEPDVDDEEKWWEEDREMGKEEERRGVEERFYAHRGDVIYWSVDRLFEDL